MPALHKTARSPQRKRLHWMLAVVALSIVATACSDDTSMQASQEQKQQQQQAQREQQPALATTFNAAPTQSTSAVGTTLQTPQSPSAQAQTASPSGASAADSVVLAPPVIHTVD